MSRPKVFISYSHRDSSELAHRLLADLAARETDVWLDVERQRGGASWTIEVEQALDRSDVVLALMSEGSYLSDACRAEQLRALRKGKCVIPLLACQNVELPIHLEVKHFLDFSDLANYDDTLEALLASIRGREGATISAAFRQTYLTVPPLPANFIDRPLELEALRRSIMSDGANRRIALTALKGMAGIGKTVLAQALCFDEVTQAAFPDGIIWLTIGKDARDLVPLFREAAKAVGDSPEGYETLQAASNRLRSRLRDRSVLIVLDDVWDVRDAAPFLVDSPRSRLLITTRDARTAVALNADLQELDVLSWDQSTQLLALWSGLSADKLPAEGDDIVRECACLPLALAMVGAQLRGKPDRWANTLDKLRSADLARIRQSFPDYPHPDLLRAIDVSLEALDAELRDRYLAFAVFPEDVSIPEAAIRTLWGVPGYDAEDAIDRLVELSLASRDDEQRLRVHDLLLDYLRRRVGADRLTERHDLFLESYRRQCPQHWADGPRDGYFFENLIWHLRHAQRSEEALHLLTDFRWMTGKLRASGVAGLLADYEWHSTKSDEARRVSESIRLSAHVLAVDHDQLAGQLLGRLSMGSSAAIDRLLASAASYDGSAWLRPLRCLLTQPGGPLNLTLAGHTARVRSVAVTQGGEWAVSASDDQTVRVWNLHRGTLERTMTGHRDIVRALVALPNGETVVSASDDHTLRMWNIRSGSEVQQLHTQVECVRVLAAFPDGRRVAAASDDFTIKIWDLTRGVVERVLRGHTGAINGLVVMPTGMTLASASDDRTIRIWNLAVDAPETVLRGHKARVIGLAAAGSRLASLSADGVARLWQLDGTGTSQLVNWTVDGVRHLSATPAGDLVVAASDDCDIHLWDVKAGSARQLEGHSDWVNSVAVTHDGRFALSGSDDCTLKVWDLHRVADTVAPRDHGDRVRHVAFVPHADAVLSSSDDQTLRVWDVASRSVRRTLSRHHQWVFACAPDGKRVVSAGSAGSCYVWDLASGEELLRVHRHQDRVRCIAVAPSGEFVVSGADDATLRVWDLVTGEQSLCVHLQRHWPRALAVTPDSRFAVTAAEGASLKLWDLLTGEEVRTYRGHTARTNAVAFSRDGVLLFSGSDDRTVNVWHVESGQLVRTLVGHDAKVNGLAVLPSPHLIASASDDGDLRVWDVQTGTTVATFSAESPLMACATSLEGGELVAGDRSGLVHFFTMNSAK